MTVLRWELRDFPTLCSISPTAQSEFGWKFTVRGRCTSAAVHAQSQTGATWVRVPPCKHQHDVCASVQHGCACLRALMAMYFNFWWRSTCVRWQWRGVLRQWLSRAVQTSTKHAERNADPVRAGAAVRAVIYRAEVPNAHTCCPHVQRVSRIHSPPVPFTW